MVAIAITRKDLTSAALRRAAARSRDAQATRRMLALALVLEGVDRKTAAQTCGMDRQTLRDWVHRYNAEDWLGSRTTAARRGAATRSDQMSELTAWLEAGPDPAADGVVRWRRQDLQARIAERFGVELHERTVGKYLAALGYRRLSVQPRHPKTDPEAQEAFKKLCRGGSSRSSRDCEGKPLEVWFQDEARVGQQGTLARVWAKRGRVHGRRATPATSGPTFLARSARTGAWPRASSCPSRTPPR